MGWQRRRREEEGKRREEREGKKEEDGPASLVTETILPDHWPL